ncbi:MAG: MarR family transcriptional regulator, partial [Delftia sp.]|nr:MarR family transcriptional regulator [Delftia sp.]
MSSPSAPFPPKQPDPAAVQRHFMFTLGQVNKQWRRTLD